MYAKASIAAAIIPMMLTGCAHNPDVTGTAEQICGTWKPVTVSKNDKITQQTASEIAGNNEARAVWCAPKKA